MSEKILQLFDRMSSEKHHNSHSSISPWKSLLDRLKTPSMSSTTENTNISSTKKSSRNSSELENPLEFLKKLVMIPSSTDDIRGVNKVQMLVKKELSAMGFKTKLLAHQQGEYANLLSGKITGNTGPTVTFVSHADTVHDGESFFRVEDGIAVGPGVIDNKGGVVVALLGLKEYLRNNRNNLNIQFICSPNEEKGSLGFHNLFQEFGRKSQLILGFEPSTADGHIINNRCGNRWYQIDVLGREAHAGRAKGEEVNAAHELLLKIQEILKLRDEFPDVKINVAQLSGGTDHYNITCGNASAKLDIRFSKFSSRDIVHEKIVEIVESPFITSIEGVPSQAKWALDDDCPPLEKSEKALLHSGVYQSIVEEIEGRKVDALFVGGASDVNHFSHIGNSCLDGLGAVGGGMHTHGEYLEISSLSTRSQALTRFLARLNGTSHH